MLSQNVGNNSRRGNRPLPPRPRRKFNDPVLRPPPPPRPGQLPSQVPLASQVQVSAQLQSPSQLQASSQVRGTVREAPELTLFVNKLVKPYEDEQKAIVKLPNRTNTNRNEKEQRYKELSEDLDVELQRYKELAIEHLKPYYDISKS